MDNENDENGSNSEGDNAEEENQENSFFDDEMGSRFNHSDDCH